MEQSCPAFTLVDGVLKILGIPFFDAMPEFGEGEAPELYAVYSLYDTPSLCGDGRTQMLEYTVTVNIFGVRALEVDGIWERLLELMQDYDFTYGGSSYGTSDDYVRYTRRTMDFKIQVEV